MGVGEGGGGQKAHSSLKSFTPSTILKFGTVIPSEDTLRRSKKYINYVTHLLNTADIYIFFTGNQQLLLYQEIQT